MACPYFFPLERIDEKAWSRHPRLPLGDPYSGVCRVDPLREWTPDQPALRDLCNLGQARHKCPRFPSENGPDAVRFSVVGDQNAVLKIVYISQNNSAAVEHGTLEYSTEKRRFLSGHPSEIMERQALAHVESYIRRQLSPDNGARNPHRR